MFPSIIFPLISSFFLTQTTTSTFISSTSIVIEVKGDCRTVGHKIAQEHGYRFVRQVSFRV
jgi:hypothetical protein